MGVFVVPGAAVAAVASTVVDPTLPVATVTLTGVEVGGERVLVEPGDAAAERLVERVLQEATTALALSTVATSRAIFETTLQYAKDREQFGKPIGSFQALKHRLADCTSRWSGPPRSPTSPRSPSPRTTTGAAVATAMAKAAAGDCQRLLARDGLQLHGGVGFTWEHDLHLLLKRAKSGDCCSAPRPPHRAHLARLLGLEAA